MIKVYLAGGFYTNWQDQIINSFDKNSFEFFNPKSHQLENSDEFYLWDTFYLEKSDMVFAYLEKTNPLALGLIYEMGYAKALNKKLILVDEKTGVDEDYDRQFRIVKKSADLVFDNFEEGRNYLKKFS